MAGLDKKLQAKIDKLQSDNLFRSLQDTERLEGSVVMRNGHKLISFSCNDYLGLTHDKRIATAAKLAIDAYGSGAGASRLITGNNPLYTKLEKQIANMCGKEAAAVFGSGYMANLGVITALVGAGDIIIADKLSHSCIIEGSHLSHAELKRFTHNDIESLESIISKYRANYKNCLVITESVFSMDGDSPDLAKMAEICDKHNAWLLIDNAHDLNHLTENLKLKTENLITMGTLSKAAGSYGGYIAGSKTLIDFLKTSSKTLMFTTGLPPAVLAASIEALQIISQEKHRAEKALANAKFFKQLVSEKMPNADLGSSDSQIVPLMVGDAADALKLSEYLLNKGFLVHSIRPPTVPVNTSRLRFSFSASHDRKDIEKLVNELAGYFKK